MRTMTEEELLQSEYWEQCVYKIKRRRRHTDAALNAATAHSVYMEHKRLFLKDPVRYRNSLTRNRITDEELEALIE